jgi:NADH-quinone oxidoreductase subunit A
MFKLTNYLLETSFFINKTESLLKFNYTFILIYLTISVVLSIVIINFSFFLAIQLPETEKLSPYECGFEPYNDARHFFEIKFYLIAILFVIFDIETMFIFPWTVTLSQLTNLGFWSIIDFIFELGIGFVYIWYIGALDWKNLGVINSIGRVFRLQRRS